MNLLVDESVGKSIVGELVFRQRLPHIGVVLIRLSGLSLPAKATNISTVLANHEDELLEAFSVISPGRLRIRRST